MPTSLNPDYGYTAGQVCLSAAIELGAVGMGDSLEDSEETEMVARFNGMLAKWATDGALFREATAEVAVTAGTGLVTLDSEIRDIRSVRHIVSATNKRMLHPWNRDEYMMLPNRAATGNPTAFYYQQRAVDGDQLRIWPVPSAEIDLELDYNRAFYIITAPEDEIDLPGDWYEAALYGLAARCSNMFGATNLNPNTVARIDMQAEATYENLLDKDRPDSYSMWYDSPLEMP